MHKNRIAQLVLIALSLLPASNLFAQPRRITTAIDNQNRLTLAGHLHPKALPEDDQGSVAPSLMLPYVSLQLKPSVAQQADLDQFLASQQDPTSANYHHWLTPEQFADRFGASAGDIAKLTAWLESQQLTVTGTGRGRNWIAVSGTAAQIQKAFGVEIHHYSINGKQHFANATEPSIPAALGAVVSAIRGLNDFRLKSAKRISKVLPRDTVHPNYTSSHGNHYIAPDDFATIYNVKPLYDGSIDGAGHNIAVVGQTQVNLTDLQQFRSLFNLPGRDPQLLQVPNTTNPGVVTDELDEADLDLEWSAAIARGANVIYVFSDDVVTSLQYAIDQAVAPVLSMSYGSCEAETPSSDAVTLQAWAQQANAQGMTWFAASGDSGATDCYDGTSKSSTALSVDLPAAIPEVTGVGGTEMNEGALTYWVAVNNTSDASALSYIPEIPWNDSTSGDPAASGGGASRYFAKPSWQTGAGVPTDGVRDVPDVSLSGSADHDGYLVYSGGNLEVIGGTSAGAPTFAGIATLLSHYLVANGIQPASGLGNINPRLYSIAQSSSAAFHDVTTGNNMINITCTRNSRNCTSGSIGYSAGPGYDQVTGLGSVDVYNFVRVWSGQSTAIAKGTAALSVTSSNTNMMFADTAVLTAVLKSANGGTPSGTVSFSLDTTLLGNAVMGGSGGTATAQLTVSGTQFAAGSNNIVVQYSGDNSYNTATASLTLAVSSPASGAPSISGVANGASFSQTFAPGAILTVFGSQLAPTIASAQTVPLPMELAGTKATINGINAPLYYISSTQLNIQIPYETAPNSTAVLTVNNNGQSTTFPFTVSAAAPGIFTDSTGAPVPYGTASRGQVTTLFISGAGAVLPAVATGAAPTSGYPAPQQDTTMTIGGASAAIQFIGIPAGLVGVVQINYQIPSNAPLGTQDVVVNVGGVLSLPAKLTITQ